MQHDAAGLHHVSAMGGDDAGGRAVSRLLELQKERKLTIEDRMDWQKHITVDPAVCHGQACVAGTRILVSVVLDNLAAGIAEEEIIASYPRLTPQSIQACIAYAADLAREQLVGLPE